MPVTYKLKELSTLFSAKKHLLRLDDGLLNWIRRKFKCIEIDVIFIDDCLKQRGAQGL